MKRVMVRYKLKADRVEENKQLVKVIFGKNPLSNTKAFPIFTKEIKDRCEEPPVAMDLSEVGSYNFY
jgi:hypothetical protein